MINVGVIGYGYWGPNLVRNYAETPGCQISAVSDRDAGRLAKAKARYPAVKTFTSVDEFMLDPGVDAVVVATPVSTHYDLAMQALKAGKHVLVEKPLASSSEQCLRLIEEADCRKKVLMVDHTFVYTSAVRKIRDLVAEKSLGDIYYYDSVRVNLGLFQRDVNVIWDLAVHDLSIMDYVLGEKVRAVSATGVSHMPGHPENIAYITLFFNSSLIGHLHVNWLAPVKVRRTLIGGSQKMIVYDDLEPSEKVKVYDKGVTVMDKPEDTYRMLIGYRAGDMWAPQIEISEALSVEARHFVACVNHTAQPMTDGHAGCRIVKILEAATRSVKARGQLVELTDE